MEQTAPEALPHSHLWGAVTAAKADLTSCSPFLTQAHGARSGDGEPGAVAEQVGADSQNQV